MAYPWRAVWRQRNASESPAPLRFLISVPKRRLRHAVDRVKMRRRCREAYRLNKELIAPTVAADVVFIYVGDRTTDYARTERAIRKMLERITIDSTTVETVNEPQ